MGRVERGQGRNRNVPDEWKRKDENPMRRDGGQPTPVSSRVRGVLLLYALFPTTWGLMWLLERSTGGRTVGNAFLAVCVVVVMAFGVWRHRKDRRPSESSTGRHS
jgi:hypothetical protein